MANRELSVEAEKALFELDWRWAKALCGSPFCPKAYIGKPEWAMVAMQYGREVGIQRIHALQVINIIQGIPSLAVKGMLGVCRSSGQFEGMEESYDEANQAFTCKVFRKGEKLPTVYTYSFKDAERAGLVNKDNWKKQTVRMLQVRARGTALSDAFADLLCGLSPEEEMLDYESGLQSLDVGTTYTQESILESPVPSNLELLISYLSEHEIPQETIDKALVYYSEKSGNSKEIVTMLTEFEACHMLEQLKKRDK